MDRSNSCITEDQFQREEAESLRDLEQLQDQAGRKAGYYPVYVPSPLLPQKPAEAEHPE